MKVDLICKECGKHETGSWMGRINEQLMERQLCFYCNHWYDLYLIRDQSNVARVAGNHYMIEKEPNAKEMLDGFMLGFGGNQFNIRFNDGREVITHNLWHQGEIPALWRDRLSNNAEFVKEQLCIPVNPVLSN